MEFISLGLELGSFAMDAGDAGMKLFGRLNRGNHGNNGNHGHQSGYYGGNQFGYPNYGSQYQYPSQSPVYYR
jgi:hypothetical protein